MAHLHSVYDNDTHFKIDPLTRVITNTTGKLHIVQFDHDSERFTFELPRYIDGHGMSLCNRVEVHYINIGTDGKRNEGVYIVDDFAVSPDDETVVIGSWLISANATQLAGSLNFLLRFACVADDGTIDYAWHTEIYSGISVSSGMNNGEAVVTEYADVLARWEMRISALENGSGGNIAVDTTLTESGKAADAAVVGKKFAEQSKAIANLEKGGMLTVETITIGGDGGETVPVTGLTLDLTSYSAKVGGGFYINPVVQPTTATNKAVTWKSSATNIATIDGNGYVECIAEGNAVITCTTADGGFTATCAVSVAADDNGGNGGGGEPELVYYTITKNLTNATINNSASSVLAGTAYTANITAASGYEISSISVVMGGINITSTAVSGNTITIAAVTGNVSITATATAQQTTGGKVQLSTLARTEGFVKADGTVTNLAKTYHVTVPYTDGMQISTASNDGWNLSTYPPIVVYDNGTYTAPGVTKGGEAVNVAGTPVTQFTATLSGYTSNAVVKVSFLYGGSGDTESMDKSDLYYYIPGGES